jgi:hypothetical protein
MTFRMLPPPVLSQQTVVVNGRTYTGQPGAAIDVVDFDAAVLGANGWAKVALSGPTSARPSLNQNAGPPYAASRGLHFYDTSISALIVFDGATWRNPAGTAV